MRSVYIPIVGEIFIFGGSTPSHVLRQISPRQCNVAPLRDEILKIAPE